MTGMARCWRAAWLVNFAREGSENERPAIEPSKDVDEPLQIMAARKQHRASSMDEVNLETMVTAVRLEPMATDADAVDDAAAPMSIDDADGHGADPSAAGLAAEGAHTPSPRCRTRGREKRRCNRLSTRAHPLGASSAAWPQARAGRSDAPKPASLRLGSYGRWLSSWLHGWLGHSNLA